MTFQPNNTLRPPLDENVSFSEEWEKFLEQITRRYRDIAREVNAKERAFYPLEEVLSAQKWFDATNPQNYKSSFRKVFTFGTIGAGAVLNIPHGITQITSFVGVYGTCITNVIDYRPIPYTSVAAVNLGIELRVDAINIIISNGAAAPIITSGTIVLEYLKN